MIEVHDLVESVMDLKDFHMIDEKRGVRLLFVRRVCRLRWEEMTV
jgi:hypothetical protein